MAVEALSALTKLFLSGGLQGTACFIFQPRLPSHGSERFLRSAKPASSSLCL